MGIFSRMGALVRGFFGIFVGGLEKKNPDMLFEDIKMQIDKTRKEAENQIIEIQTNAELIKIEMKSAEKNLSAVQSRVEAAQRTGDKDILVELLMQEDEYQNVYETHKSTYESAIIEVDKIREDYKIFESEMNQKLNEIKSLKTQAKMANLKENINSINSRYSARGNKVGEVNEGIERARAIVNEKTARANAIESLGSNNIDMKLKKLDMNSARDRAKARAEALLAGSGGFEVKEKINNSDKNTSGVNIEKKNVDNKSNLKNNN
ncbi:MAG: PspA/IM30 family protein [Clostridiales bacterium]